MILRLHWLLLAIVLVVALVVALILELLACLNDPGGSSEEAELREWELQQKLKGSSAKSPPAPVAETASVASAEEKPKTA